jgi:integrase
LGSKELNKLKKQPIEPKQEVNNQPQDIGKLNIPNVMLWMLKNAYEQTTIKRVAKELRHLERNCNTSNPEEVKLFIAKKNCSNARKENLIESYNIVVKSLGLTWNKPFYERYDKKHRAPKEALLDFMIKHFRLEMALKLSILKDLGTRPQELLWLTVKDIDLTTGMVSITGAKHTVGRDGKIKATSIALLKIYIEKKQLNANSKLFKVSSSDYLGDMYRHARNRLAMDYNMPELKQICLYDFRRFKASKEYTLSKHNTFYVKQLLGHKDFRSIERYISVFDDSNVNWIPVICHNQAEIGQAIKDDCTLVCQSSGITYFKKPA